MSKDIKPIPFQTDFTKPLDVLFHCHQKIAANLEALRRACAVLHKREVRDFRPVLATIDMVLTHLSTAGVKHTEDEEESLFPRMRARGDSLVAEVFEALGRLELQHRGAESIESSLEKIFVSMSADEAPDEKKAELFCDLSESLYDLYRPHIRIENEFVFPAAGKILSADELLAVGREMYQRRQPLIHPLKSD